MSTFGKGIVIRFGANHNSIAGAAGKYDMSNPDTEQRKALEKHGRNMMHDAAVSMFTKPGKDRNRQRRQRKGYSHA